MLNRNKMEYGRMLADPQMKRRFNVLIMCIRHWVCGQKELKTVEESSLHLEIGQVDSAVVS